MTKKIAQRVLVRLKAQSEKAPNTSLFQRAHCTGRQFSFCLCLITFFRCLVNLTITFYSLFSSKCDILMLSKSAPPLQQVDINPKIVEKISKSGQNVTKVTPHTYFFRPHPCESPSSPPTPKSLHSTIAGTSVLTAGPFAPLPSPPT